MGGMLGALFNRLHREISWLRLRCYRGGGACAKAGQVTEVVVWSFVTSAVMFSLALFGGTCQPLKQQEPELCNATVDPFILQWGSPVSSLQCDENQYLSPSTDHTPPRRLISDVKTPVVLSTLRFVLPWR